MNIKVAASSQRLEQIADAGIKGFRLALVGAYYTTATNPYSDDPQLFQAYKHGFARGKEYSNSQWADYYQHRERAWKANTVKGSEPVAPPRVPDDLFQSVCDQRDAVDVMERREVKK